MEHSHAVDRNKRQTTNLQTTMNTILRLRLSYRTHTFAFAVPDSAEDRKAEDVHGLNVSTCISAVDREAVAGNYGSVGWKEISLS